jgi:hypothetical protein
VVGFREDTASGANAEASIATERETVFDLEESWFEAGAGLVWNFLVSGFEPDAKGLAVGPLADDLDDGVEVIVNGGFLGEELQQRIGKMKVGSALGYASFQFLVGMFEGGLGLLAVDGNGHLVRHDFHERQVIIGEPGPHAGGERKTAQNAALDRQRVRGVSLDATGFGELGARVEGVLNVLNYNTTGVAGRATADARTIVEPFNLAGHFVRDAGTSVEVELAALFIREVIEEELAIKEIEHALAEAVDDTLRGIGGEQVASGLGEEFDAALSP